MIEIVNLPVEPEAMDEVTPEVHGDWTLPSVAYAAFFTEAEREEIGSFDELPAHERARWQSVAAHIARTVVSPIDEDLEQWRAEQQAKLAEQVRAASYSREVGWAMTRTTDLQHRIESLRTLLQESRASAAVARSHSRRLAGFAQALEGVVWWDAPSPGHPTRPGDEPDGADGASARLPVDIAAKTDRPLRRRNPLVRGLRATGGE